MNRENKIKSTVNDLDITPLLRFLLWRNSPFSSPNFLVFFFHLFFHPPQVLTFINLPISLPLLPVSF